MVIIYFGCDLPNLDTQTNKGGVWSHFGLAISIKKVY